MADRFPTVVAKFSATKDIISAWIRGLEHIRPPAAIFHDEVQALQRGIQRERERIGSGLDESALNKALDNLLRHSAKLRETELDYKVSAPRQENAYQDKMRVHVETLFRDMAVIVGPSIAKAALNDILQIDRPEPRADSPQKDSIEVILPQAVQPVDQKRRPSEALSPHGKSAQSDTFPASSSVTGDACSEKTPNLTKSSRPGIESTISNGADIPPQPRESPTIRMQQEVPPTRSLTSPVQRKLNTPASRGGAMKRKADTQAALLREELKRVRVVDPKGYRTWCQRKGPIPAQLGIMDFEDLFRNGKGEEKHVVFQFPARDGEWYILRCDHHKVHFGRDPVRKAVTHIQKVHGIQLDDLDELEQIAMAIDMIGIEIRHCTTAQAAKNNAVAQKAFGPRSAAAIANRADNEDGRIGDDETPGPGDRGRSRGTSPTTSLANRPNRKGVVGVVDAVPGTVYLGYRGKARNWFAVLVLTLGSFDDIGLEGTIDDSGLLNSVPSCYRYNPRTRQIVGWQKDFEDGGPLVGKRLFPVMWFDDWDFPGNATAGWIAARDLKPFEPKDTIASSLVPHHRSVLEFLADRSGSSRAASQPEDSREDGRSDKADNIERSRTSAPTRAVAPAPDSGPPAPCNLSARFIGDETSVKVERIDVPAPQESIPNSLPDSKSNTIIIDLTSLPVQKPTAASGSAGISATGRSRASAMPQLGRQIGGSVVTEASGSGRAMGPVIIDIPSTDSSRSSSPIASPSAANKDIISIGSLLNSD